MKQTKHKLDRVIRRAHTQLKNEINDSLYEELDIALYGFPIRKAPKQADAQPYDLTIGGGE